MEPFLVGFGASGVDFGAAMWGSEVSFANNGVRRSEMWGSWPPSPPTLDEYRDWKYHLDHVSSKLSSANFVLSKFKNLLPTSILEKHSL